MTRSELPSNGSSEVSTPGSAPGKAGSRHDGSAQTGLQSGDRASFLARLAGGLSEPTPPNLAHPLPAPLTAMPVVRSSALVVDDLTVSFERAAEALSCVVHRVDAARVAAVITEIAASHGARSAVVSSHRELATAALALTHAGIDVRPPSQEAAATADIGITLADGAIATTGSIVQRSDRAGGRTTSLLPPVHLCVVPVGVIVGSLAEMFATLDPKPSNTVIITGPSRSGDIENTLVRGVHGPICVEIVLIGP